MLIGRDQLRSAVLQVMRQRLEQGCAIDEPAFQARVEAAADSYDGLYQLAQELRDPPLRKDWPYREPLAWEHIVAESPQLDPDCAWPEPDLARAAECARAGFLGSVCGCVLGKPVEVDPTLAELKQAGRALGEWPFSDYVTVEFLERLGRRHDSWTETTRGNICAVAADDDIHYSLLGMLLLEAHGPGFNRDDMYQAWALNIAHGWTWGPERTALLHSGLGHHHLFDDLAASGPDHDVLLLNPGDEMCGALIRADAYGYACPGNPDLAAWLAWKDASFTHIRTGVYGPMFVAALIALCHLAAPGRPGNQRLALAEEARRRIPARSRLSEVLDDALQAVSAAGDWESGYRGIHRKYARFTHCRVYQEVGTLLNTLKFAEDVGHGIGLQVSQGNDTDSFGATAGSMLGVLFGPGHLAAHWLEPFGNRIEHALAGLHEFSLDTLAGRMAQLPARVYTGAAGRPAGDK